MIAGTSFRIAAGSRFLPLWISVAVVSACGSGLDNKGEREPAPTEDTQRVQPDDTAFHPVDTGEHDATNQAPVADAGEDQETAVNAVTTLDGSGSSDPDGDDITYDWYFIQTPSGSGASLMNSSRESPQFVPDIEGDYTIELVVSDGELDSEPDTVSVMAEERNNPPEADAGSDRSVTVGDRVQLDGSGSYDPDGDVLTYAWTLVTRPTGSAAALDDATAVAPTFEADVEGRFVAELVVSDGQDDSDPDSVSVTASENGGSDSGCSCAREAEILLKRRAVLGALVLFPWWMGRRGRRYRTRGARPESQDRTLR